MEYVSTSALANELDLKPAELFEKLKTLGWIEKKNDKWILTDFGRKKGGKSRNSPNYGEYVVWPEDISIEGDFNRRKSELLSATIIGKHFNVSPQRLNLIFSELGWIEKDLAGWALTKLGKNVGGRQYEHETSGGFYVKWPELILTNKSLLAAFGETLPEKSISKETESKAIPQENMKSPQDSFRNKYEATHRTKDGHYVRSRAEVIIDDTLYDYGLVHAYEKQVPIVEDLFTDFYLPSGKVYIEYWGLEKDPKYQERKKIKQELYKKYELKLIELVDEDILNLDDHLPRKLLKFGIKVY